MESLPSPRSARSRTCAARRVRLPVEGGKSLDKVRALLPAATAVHLRHSRVHVHIENRVVLKIPRPEPLAQPILQRIVLHLHLPAPPRGPGGGRERGLEPVHSDLADYGAGEEVVDLAG